MQVSRFLGPFLASFFALFAWAYPATGAEPPQSPVARGPHRIEAALGVAGTYTGFDSDGHWDDTASALTGRFGYGYSLTQSLELEGKVAYLEMGCADPWDRTHTGAVLPSIGLRPHFAPSESVELGLSVRLGGYFLFLTNVPDDMTPGQRDHLWVGTHFALAPDVRIWLNRAVALQLAPEVVIGSARDHGDTPGYYLRDRASMLSLGAWASVVLAP